MTDLAIQHVFSVIDDALKNMYGLQHGLSEPLSNPNLKSSAPRASALFWIEEGSEREDDFPFPVVRPLRHFHNPLYPLSVAGLGVGIRFESSISWAQELPGTQDSLEPDVPSDNMSWRDARRYLQNALADPDSSKREANFAATFDALGHVMHLVQDASVPAHVRNDPHVGLGLEAYPLPPEVLDVVDADGFHRWVDDHLGAIPSWGISEPDALLLTSGGIEHTLPISNLIDANVYTGANPEATLRTSAGVSEFSNSHFFSDDTILKSDFPHPAARNLVPFIDPDNGLTYEALYRDGGALPGASPIVQHAALCGVYSSMLPPSGSCLGIGLADDKVFTDYARQLVPRAIGYSAALLTYFFRGSMDVTVTGSGLTITNTSQEDMTGVVTVYYDDTNDKRYAVPNASYQITISAGTSQDNLSFAAPTHPAPKQPGKYIVVFEGTLGAEDGAVVGAQVNADDVFYISPQVFCGPPACIVPTPITPATIQELGTGVIVDGLANPSGLAVDDAGNLYFGDVTYSPLRVQLRKRTPDGQVTNLGTVVDTSAGLTNFAGFNVVANTAGDVFYITPQVFCGPPACMVPTPIEPARIQKLGTGVIVDGLANPSGLAVDDAGNLYFGDVTYSPLRVQLRKRTPDGQVTNLGTVVDTSAGLVTFSGFNVVAPK